MRYTDQLFRLPAIMYDGNEVMKAMKREEATDAKIDVDYTIVKAKIPLEEIRAYYEAWTRDLTVQDVNQQGPNATMILTRTLGDYLCSWKVDRFEEEYNKHSDKLEEYYKTLEKEVETLTKNQLLLALSREKE